MIYTIITDHDEKRIMFGKTTILKQAFHSMNSTIDFVQSPFQMEYATRCISLTYPLYKMCKINKKVS